MVNLPVPLLKPSWLQTTVASKASQSSSQTVPQLLLMHTSTLPSCEASPSARRISPSEQMVTLEAVRMYKVCSNNTLFID